MPVTARCVLDEPVPLEALGGGAGDANHCLQSVAVRHTDVHEHDIGTLPSHKGNRFVAGGSLAYHGDVRLVIQQRTEPRTHELLIVCKRDPDHDISLPAASGSMASTTNPPRMVG